jgi:hypothetical protein
MTMPHPTLGLIVLGALFFQPVLGWVHHARFKRLKRRTAWSHTHLWLGRIVVTLGMINGGLGLQLAGATKSAIIAYAVIATAVWFLLVICALFGHFRGQNVPTKTPSDTRSHNGPRP